MAIHPLLISFSVWWECLLCLQPIVLLGAYTKHQYFKCPKPPPSLGAGQTRETQKMNQMFCCFHIQLNISELPTSGSKTEVPVGYRSFHGVSAETLPAYWGCSSWSLQLRWWDETCRQPSLRSGLCIWKLRGTEVWQWLCWHHLWPSPPWGEGSPAEGNRCSSAAWANRGLSLQCSAAGPAPVCALRGLLLLTCSSPALDPTASPSLPAPHLFLFPIYTQLGGQGTGASLPL